MSSENDVPIGIVSGSIARLSRDYYETRRQVENLEFRRGGLHEGEAPQNYQDSLKEHLDPFENRFNQFLQEVPVEVRKQFDVASLVNDAREFILRHKSKSSSNLS